MRFRGLVRDTAILEGAALWLSQRSVGKKPKENKKGALHGSRHKMRASVGRALKLTRSIVTVFNPCQKKI